ncbi:MAG: alpha/beta hydrolase family protein [Planctomycetota bacterium]
MRRCLLRSLGICAIGFAALGGARPGLFGAEREARRLDPARLLVYLDERGAERPVETAADWAVRRRAILEGMQAVMGELPDRSRLPPLDVREVGRAEEADHVRIEISFVAEEGDRVPADLYLPKPKGAGEKHPAALALHPTHPLGKRTIGLGSPEPNRGYAPELARRGYIVIAPDYPSFGDYAYDFDRDRYVSGTMKGIFNHMRCVDLLISRDDVDPERIAAIGHSLGGHNAIFVAAFDERIRAVVSSCGWTPFRDYYGGDISGWTSPRYMPRLRDAYGLDPERVPFDFYEVIAALAPRAFFSSSPLRDANFDVAGVRKAEAEARKVYRLLGAEGRFEVVCPDCGHDFPPEIRERAYRFLDGALRGPSGGASGAARLNP